MPLIKKQEKYNKIFVAVLFRGRYTYSLKDTREIFMDRTIQYFKMTSLPNDISISRNSSGEKNQVSLWIVTNLF